MTRRPKTKHGDATAPTIEITDTGLRLAIAEVVGHDAPFTGAECASIKRVRIDRAREISGLAACPNLESVTLKESEVDSLAPLAGLSRLTHVWAAYNSLRDISAVRDCPEMTSVSVKENLIEDIEPLLGLNLTSINIIGNPLSERSYRVVLPKLCAAPPLYGLPREVHFSDEEEWLLTRELQARGFEAIFTHGQQTLQTFVLRPGLRHGDHPESDALPISATELRKELARPGLTYDELIARYKQR